MAARSKNLAALKRERTRRLARLGARVYYLHRRGREQEMYNLICDEFLALGGVYVKFLQGVLFATPVMKRWHNPARLKIFENLDTQPIDVVRLLREELTPDRLQKLTFVQQEPFAAGSFGQVYLGQHSNGQTIIIKVLRPTVRELLRFDLRLLSMFGRRFVAQEYTDFTIKVNTAIKEFRVATLNETDYLAEAQFANELYEAYKGHATIVVPKTYLDLCTPHIIVQDFVEGISGAELLKVQEAGGDPALYVYQQLGSDLDTQLRNVGEESFIATFALPRIPGDPHPGNLRFMTNNRVGLIDFGIAAPAPRNRPAFYALLKEWYGVYDGSGTMGGLFEQFMRYFVNDLYRALKKLSAILPRSSSEKNGENQPSPLAPGSNADLVQEVGRLVESGFQSTADKHGVRTLIEQGQLMSLFGQVVNKDNRLGLIIQLESSEFLRASQTYVAFLNALHKRSLFFAILRNSLDRIADEFPRLINETDSTVSTSQAIAIINKWLERVALRDPLMFAELMRRISPREKAAKLQAKETGDA